MTRLSDLKHFSSICVRSLFNKSKNSYLSNACVKFLNKFHQNVVSLHYVDKQKCCPLSIQILGQHMKEITKLHTKWEVV